MKKAGIIGSGPVAHALGEGLLSIGYEVMLGTRDPGKLKEWQNKSGEKARIGTFQEAADFGEIIVLCVKGSAAMEVVKNLKGRLTGKIILDTTIPISDTAPENGVLLFFSNINKSLMEQLQEISPEARFVKAFNCIGSSLMVNPSFDQKPSIFICGNNKEAKNKVSEIIRQFGHTPEDMGMVEAARAIEPLCMLWCIPGFLSNEWNHAFRWMK
jgi:predicted dinucleotide-binding enzyme